MRPSVPLALVTLAAAAALACGDPLAPGDVAGRYALGTIAGAPLPAVSWETADYTIRTLTDTLTLGADGRGVEVSVRETIPRRVAGDGPTRVESEVGYRIVDDRIEITYVCPPNANCIAGPHLIGRRTDRGLRVEPVHGGRSPLEYVEVGGAR